MTGGLGGYAGLGGYDPASVHKDLGDGGVAVRREVRQRQGLAFSVVRREVLRADDFGGAPVMAAFLRDARGGRALASIGHAGRPSQLLRPGGGGIDPAGFTPPLVLQGKTPPCLLPSSFVLLVSSVGCPVLLKSEKRVEKLSRPAPEKVPKSFEIVLFLIVKICH